MRKINLGIIGLGSIGRMHLSNSLLLESAEVTAVCDVSKNSLKFAEKMGVKKSIHRFPSSLKE